MNTPEHLIACAGCACFHRADDDRCPHCGHGASSTGALTVTAAALMVGIAATGCIGPGDRGGDSQVVALYGVADTSMMNDADGDGFSENDGDCNDDDDTIHPDAEETAGDGVDSNCDGDDDT